MSDESDPRVPPLPDPNDDGVVTCKICTEEYPAGDMWCLQHCGCLYCQQCLKQYVTFLVNERMSGKGIACPDAFCKVPNSKLSDQEVLSFTDADHHAKYLEQKEELEVAMDPRKSWCPAPRCGAVCVVRDDRTHCHKCNLQFCSQCKASWEDGHRCSALADTSNSIVLTVEEEQVEFKRCPRCEVLIERDLGCAQILCLQCNHVFCWHCLQSLEDDIFLHHFDRGPCQGKLGHSRPRLHLYRLQVICLLFGLVLLAFFLLPCILIGLPFYYCFCWKRCSPPPLPTTTNTNTNTTPTNTTTNTHATTTL